MKHEKLLLKSALALAIVDLVLIAAILLQVNNLVKDVLEVQNEQAEIGVMKKTPKEEQEKKIEQQRTYLPIELQVPGEEIANWQTYKNEKFGFEIKYPNENLYDINFFDHTLTDGTLDPKYSYLDPLYFAFAGLILKQKNTPPYHVDYEIGVLYATNNIKDQLKKKIYHVDSQTGICNDEIKLIKINGVDAFRVSYLIPFQTKIEETKKNYEKYCGGGYKNILWTAFSRNGKLYLINWFAPYYFLNENELIEKKEYELYNQIISTFKFIK